MAFHKPVYGDDVAHTDLVQIIEALDGTAAVGEPLKITKVNDASNYALDLMNLDTVNGYGLRVRDPSGNDVLRTNKNQIDVGKDLVLGAGITVDTVDVSAHTHTGASGHGLQIPTGGIANGAITTAKIGDGQVTEAKLWTTIATRAELDAHTNATAAVHGLADGSYVLGTKAGATRRIEAKSGSQVVGGSQGDVTITVTWDNAFSTAIAAASSFGRSSGDQHIERIKGVSLSATGASHTFTYNDGTGTTFVEYWIAFGH